MLFLIFKKGSRSLVENYRPISLTSVVFKLMEVFVKRVIMQHLTDQKLVPQTIWIYQWQINYISATYLPRQMH